MKPSPAARVLKSIKFDCNSLEAGNEEGQFYVASTLEIPLELGFTATYRAAFVQCLPILPGMRGLNKERSGGDKLFLVETCFGR